MCVTLLIELLGRMGHLDTRYDYGADLEDVELKVIDTSQIVEILSVQPVISETQRCGCSCLNCGKEQSTDYP